MGTNYAESEQVRFELPNAFTWGVKKDRYSGYSIPVVLDDETAGKIEGLVGKYGTKNPLYGKTLYLKVKNLSGKQMSELFDKGRNPIEVHFVLKDVYINTNTQEHTKYLTFKVTKLRKTEKPESDDSCPED
jgi:hypothetical protein